MKTLLVAVFLIFVVGLLVTKGCRDKTDTQSRVPGPIPAPKPTKKSEAVLKGPAGRLSETQLLTLSSASFDKPIFAENPGHMFSQMPGGEMAHNQRTVDSLVKRGYLAADGRGGYLLTQEGATAVKKGMGF